MTLRLSTRLVDGQIVLDSRLEALKRLTLGKAQPRAKQRSRGKETLANRILAAVLRKNQA
jgi:hypothetical protein